MAAGGRLWGITKDTAVSAKWSIWYSDSDGDSWTLSKTVTGTVGQKPIKVCPHPTNPLRIAVIVAETPSGTKIITWTTLDEGTDGWTSADGGQLAPSNGHSMEFVMLDSNRMVGAGFNSGGLVIPGGPSQAVILTSDNNGDTWTIRYTARGNPLSDGTFISGPAEQMGASGVLVCVEYDGISNLVHILISINGGFSWFKSSYTVPRFSSSDRPNGGITFDPRENAVYVAHDGGQTVERFYVIRLTPLTGQGATIEDFSDTSIPAGETSYSHPIRHQSMAIVPGV